MSQSATRPFPFRRLQLLSLSIGGAWVIACIIGWILEPEQFYRSYLFAWLFCLGVSLGSMGVVMMHHLIGGEWGIVSRRLGEHAAMCLPLMIVLFIPIAIGVPSLYEWAQPDKVRADPFLQHKQPYLNYTFFLCRAAIYAAIWLGMAWYLRRGSLRFDRTADPAIERRTYNLSGIGELLLFVTMTLAALDWIMSRDARWISTVFGLIVVTGQGVSGLCFMMMMVGILRNQPPFRDIVRRDHFNDLGNILLTFVITWTYMSFVQLLVIWMANRQDEITWYVARLSNGWWWIGFILLGLHFFVPFFVLLMRDAKRAPGLMTWFCAGLLVMRAIDVFWMVAPSGGEPRPLLRHVLSWMDFVFPIGMGGLWFAFFLWLMDGHPLIIEGQTVVDAELHDAES
jgi:hypothetical protein